MSVTDSAFIKAFTDKSAVTFPRPSTRQARKAAESNSESAPAPSEQESVGPDQVSEQVRHMDRRVTVATEEPDMQAVVKSPELQAGHGIEADTNRVEQAAPADEPNSMLLETFGCDLRQDQAEVSPSGPLHAAFFSSIDVASNQQDTVVDSLDDVAHDENPPRASGTEAAPSLTTKSVERSELFRPQWEVDTFSWPAVLDGVIARHRTALEQVVQKIGDEIPESERVVAITSFERGEGRTTFGLALAKVAAEQGMNVAVVDGDFDRANLASQLGMSVEIGWDEPNSDSMTPADFAVQSLADNLTVLPLRRGAARAAELELNDRSADLVDVLARSHDLVLIDVGPMYLAASRWLQSKPQTVAPHALVVRDVSTASEHHLTDVVDRLEAAGVKVMGIAENRHAKQVSDGASANA